MAWPTPTDYRHAIQDPRSVLDDEELREGAVACTSQGLPMLWAGNFASVYKIHCGATGKTWALKCFNQEVHGQGDRYRSIGAHLEQAGLPFAVDFRYMDQGIRIAGAWYPALKMRWIEGLTLNQFVKEHLQRPRNLRLLLDLWVKLAARLREARMAHADLQHGNVLLVPMERGALGLRLIDYDGMYVPALAGSRSGELGHPAYQHPQRLREGIYSAEVDRFAHLAIYSAVRCLMAGQHDLWRRFDNGDNLLFRESDFRRPEASDVFRTLWELRDAEARALVGRLVLACGRPLDQTPLLNEFLVNGKVLPLSRGEETAVNGILLQRPFGVSALEAVAPFGPPVLPVAESMASVGQAALAEMLPQAAVSTQPASSQGTLPAVIPLGEAVPPHRRILSLLQSAVVPVRAANRLLLRVAWRHNTILPNLLRVAAAIALLSLVGLALKMALPVIGSSFASRKEGLLSQQEPAAASRVAAEPVAETRSLESTTSLNIQPVPPQTIELGKVEDGEQPESLLPPREEGTSGAKPGASASASGGTDGRTAADAQGLEPARERTALLAKYESLKYGMFIHFSIATFTGDKSPAKVAPSLYAPANPDARQWVRVARQAGMKYAILTVCHRAGGGFCLWDAKDDDYNVAHSGSKLDIVAAFMDACQMEGIEPGLFYAPGETRDYATARKQVAELAQKYPKMFLMQFHSNQKLDLDQRTEVYRLVKSINPQCLVLNTWPTDVLVSFGLSSPRPFKPLRIYGGLSYYLPGECMASMFKGTNQWFWAAGVQTKPADSLFDLYSKCVVGPCNFLLGVGPDRTGRIPAEQVQRLMELKTLIDASGTTHGVSTHASDKTGR